MKRFVFISILIPLLAMSLMAKVDMKFEKVSMDFGEVEAGKTVSVEFKFVNAGDETLVISAVNTSCGCTAPKLDKMEYKPGEKGVMPVAFNSQGYNGPVAKSITINTNSKENPFTRLEIKGTVKMTQYADIEMVPGSDRIEFKNAKIGQPYTEKVKITNSGTIPLRIMEYCSSPEVNLVFPKKDLEPKESTEVKIVFTPMQAGPFSTFVKIHTNAYKQRMIIIKVTSDIK